MNHGGQAWLLALAAGLASSGVMAGEADVVGADVRATGDGTYSFQVTVRHEDEGWDHYADQWQVLAPDGTELGTRTLHHPHVDEQPFTRSLPGVEIPEEIDSVRIRARDSVHGHGGAEMELSLPDRE
ncbi:hypothetical protein QWY84_17660 [Aquisalimonas lutea]|uniref:hypothetical protein n=1 Tax=Aquisalimonas lutea TaxID=1327750 RepID=UPI0025B2A42D|nr:hypothetical protein [Aquisalimonas lutea]MDN3519437.1 hypothetical protein [Aquisalimonas lutea]